MSRARVPPPSALYVSPARRLSPSARRLSPSARRLSPSACRLSPSACRRPFRTSSSMSSVRRPRPGPAAVAAACVLQVAHSSVTPPAPLAAPTYNEQFTRTRLRTHRRLATTAGIRPTNATEIRCTYNRYAPTVSAIILYRIIDRVRRACKRFVWLSRRRLWRIVTPWRSWVTQTRATEMPRGLVASGPPRGGFRGPGPRGPLTLWGPLQNDIHFLVYVVLKLVKNLSPRSSAKFVHHTVIREAWFIVVYQINTHTKLSSTSPEARWPGRQLSRC